MSSFKLTFRDRIRIEEMIVQYKPGTKSPTAMNVGIKAENLLARINEKDGKIVFIPPDQGIKIKKNDVVVDEKSILINGQSYFKKYRVKDFNIVDHYPFNQVNLIVELIEE